MAEKKPLTGIFRENPETSEGKYLVKRRDGSVVEWPSFVLAGPDPVAVKALRAYATEVERLLDQEPEVAAGLGFTHAYVLSVFRWAEEYDRYRREHGASDPGMGKHRTDDPATIEEMRKGKSA